MDKKENKKRVLVDVNSHRLTAGVRKGRKKLTEDQIDQAVLMYNSGATQRAIAEHFHLSIPTVRKYLRERLPKAGEC